MFYTTRLKLQLKTFYKHNLLKKMHGNDFKNIKKEVTV